MTISHIVVVGASLAGTLVADTLRQNGFDGRITLLGAEPTPAYNRPALSKGILAGTEKPEDIRLEPFSGDVEVRLDAPVVSANLDERQIVLASGERIGFDGLAITTGARARRLADLGAADVGVREITFRDVRDAMWLSHRLAGQPRVVIVGAGILGTELASACVARGAEVTVVGRRPPLLAQRGEYLADLVAGAARSRGVRFVCHPSVRVRGTTAPVVELGDGRRYTGDLVLSAVGCAPNIEWLGGTGLPTPGGVRVDDRGRVRPGVVAAGDVAAFPAADGHRRTPLWNSALEQARTAALALLCGDAAPPVRRSPYFWTEQFGVAIKICGRLPVPGTPAVLDGTPEIGLLLQWTDRHGPTTAAPVNKRVPIGKLRALARTAQ